MKLLEQKPIARGLTIQATVFVAAVSVLSVLKLARQRPEHGWDDDWGSFAAGAIVGGATGVAIAGYNQSGTVVDSLPPTCSTVVVNADGEPKARK